MPRRCARAESGFTYLAVLLAVALHGAVLAAVGTVWHTAQKREKEKELLFIGEQFRRALRSYAASGAGAAGQLPRTLDDLLKDPRSPAVKRHLRKIFYDPMTGTREWGLVKTPDGQAIVGVYSLSEEAPLKVGRFDEADKQFENKTKYSEWKFVYSTSAGVAEKTPGAEAQPPGTATAPGTLAPGMQFGVNPPKEPEAVPSAAPGQQPAQSPSRPAGFGPSPVQPSR